MFPTHGEGVSAIVDDEAFPSVEEISPHNPDVRSDLTKSLDVAPGIFVSTITSKELAKLKAKFGLPNHVKPILTSGDVVHVHHPRYCALYTYPFLINYSFPLLPLVEELCRHYAVCPA